MRYNHYFADVSAYQPNVNMHDYADAGHLLIAIKATEGLNYVNPYHRGMSYAAGARHVAVVHYHFARPDLGNSPQAEAEHFVRTVKHLGGPFDYLVLDLERGTPQGWSHDPAWSKAFDARLRELIWYRTILYASRSALQESHEWLYEPPFRVWDAAYGTEPDYAPPGYEVMFRQYTDGIVGPEPHTFAGIGRCDGNRMSHATFNHLLEYR